MLKTLNTRYYLWDYCDSYGWRQRGNMSGYATLKELKADNSYIFVIKNKDLYKILKAEVLESGGEK